MIDTEYNSVGGNITVETGLVLGSECRKHHVTGESLPVVRSELFRDEDIKGQPHVARVSDGGVEVKCWFWTDAAGERMLVRRLVRVDAGDNILSEARWPHWPTSVSLMAYGRTTVVGLEALAFVVTP